MTISQLDQPQFDRIVSLSEANVREETQRTDEAFAAAMNREIKCGRIKARPGTFVDRSPHYGARRIHGDAPHSSCGSPAAMCLEASGDGNGVWSTK